MPGYLIPCAEKERVLLQDGNALLGWLSRAARLSTTPTHRNICRAAHRTERHTTIFEHSSAESITSTDDP